MTTPNIKIAVEEATLVFHPTKNNHDFLMGRGLGAAKCQFSQQDNHL